MKVILQKTIATLGDAGDQKEVADGYARNYLIPNNLAIALNKNSLKTVRHRELLIQQKVKKNKKEMKILEEKILSLGKLEIKMSSETGFKLHGAVTGAQVSKLLEKHTISIDKRRIYFPSSTKKGETSTKINSVGDHRVSFHLMEGIQPELTLSVIKVEKKSKRKEKKSVQPEEKNTETKAKPSTTEEE